MARTQLTTREISSVQRNDFDTTTTGQAVVAKLVAGTNVTFSSTGVDAGTGDVTINAASGGAGATYTAQTTSATLVISTINGFSITAAETATLPTAVGNSGSTIRVIWVSGAYVLSMATTSSQTINGVAPSNITFNRLSQAYTFVSDGSNWQII